MGAACPSFVRLGAPHAPHLSSSMLVGPATALPNPRAAALPGQRPEAEEVCAHHPEQPGVPGDLRRRPPRAQARMAAAATLALANGQGRLA